MIKIIFYVGEEKTCGVSVLSSDGSNFEFQSATYEYVNGSGTVLLSGNATIDNIKKECSVLLEPSVTGSLKVLMTINPLLATGGADTSRNVETIVGKIQIVVNQ